ncbi:transposase family protein, partial [Methylobacterium sp. E-066]|nr:transposase family protein [Methylobacterium sp. E-066]
MGVLVAAVLVSGSGNARHELAEILFNDLAARLCGGETWVDMAEFGAAKAD